MEAPTAIRRLLRDGHGYALDYGTTVNDDTVLISRSLVTHDLWCLACHRPSRLPCAHIIHLTNHLHGKVA